MKNNITAIDNLKPASQTPKPIELTHCLQASNSKDGDAYFMKSNFSDVYCTSLTRIGRLGKSYTNLVSKDIVQDDAGNLFLGNWNDGVVSCKPGRPIVAYG